MLTGPYEAAPISRDCQLKKMVVVRPLVPKGLIFLARRIQPFLSLVDLEGEFCVTI